jgi:hypothetical protein
MGAGTAVVGGYVIRPMLVSVVSGGLALKNCAIGTWQQVRSEAAKVAEDAGKVHFTLQEASDLMAEFRLLRDDVNIVKGMLGVASIL